jgi:hypothetical protein
VLQNRTSEHSSNIQQLGLRHRAEQDALQDLHQSDMENVWKELTFSKDAATRDKSRLTTQIATVSALKDTVAAENVSLAAALARLTTEFTSSSKLRVAEGHCTTYEGQLEDTYGQVTNWQQELSKVQSHQSKIDVLGALINLVLLKSQPPGAVQGVSC